MPKEPTSKVPDEKEVKIYSVATTVTECIVFLEELEGDRLLPIWIGQAEGQAIAIKFSGIVLPRPLTHDLLLATVKALGWTVEKAVVEDLKDNTFYAKVHLRKDGETRLIDARPSDAIAVAVRAGCHIYVKESVFEKCQVLTKPLSEDDVKKFKQTLKDLRPEDIFKDLKKKRDKPKMEDQEKGDKGKGEEDE